MHRAITVALVVAAALSSNVRLGAQTFEAAAIKRSPSRDATEVVPAVFLPGGRWSARSATLSMILRSAYALPPDRIIGLPSWARSERFDIVAKADSNIPLERMRVMAQHLLAERFGLLAHFEPRITEVYALVRAKTSGALGPGLRLSTTSCQPTEGSRAVSGRIDSTPCREQITAADGGAMRYQLRDRPLVDLLTLSGARSQIGEPIVDRTGLAGRFDIDLVFVDEHILRTTEPSTAAAGVPLAIAVVDQLGLRFERRREPFDVLVIERVTMPSFD
jgi:uncharacterized protein (TIGR03435 family)